MHRRRQIQHDRRGHHLRRGTVLSQKYRQEHKGTLSEHDHTLPEFITFSISSKHETETNRVLGIVLRLMYKKGSSFALAYQSVGDGSWNEKDVDENNGEPQRQHDGPMLPSQALY